MYIPLIAIVSYFYYCNKRQTNDIDSTALQIVIFNLLQIEIIYFVAWLLNVFPNEYNFFNLLMIIILQDVYFYSIHKLFHIIPYLANIHALHHAIFEPFYAFYTTKLNHLAMNIGSIAVPFMLFPINSTLMTLLISVEIYLVVDAHDKYSVRSNYIHYSNPKKRLGTIYLMDRLFGTY